MRKELENTLAEWIEAQTKEFPQRIKRLMNSANFDLYHGPDVEDDDYPGFVVACKELRQFFDDVACELWIDVDSGEVMTSEPRAYAENFGDGDEWIEPNWETIYHVERREVLNAFLGSELAASV